MNSYSSQTLQDGIKGFVEEHALKGGKVVPARVQAALALLERLREHPFLTLEVHTTNGGASVISHESYGDAVHKKFNLDPINKNHGRRSSNLPSWGQHLLNVFEQQRFLSGDAVLRDQLITDGQKILADILHSIINQEPLKARTASRTVEATLHEILIQAEEKGQSGNVAQYLVGAKLQLRLGIDIPAQPANTSDRKHRNDEDAKWGDFEIEDAVIEVAVGIPDEKHLEQVLEIVEETNHTVWLLTRLDRAASWKNEILGCVSSKSKRVVVTSVESFVGQNISELGAFSTNGQKGKLAELFDLYNEKWVAAVGTPGIRIQMV